MCDCWSSKFRSERVSGIRPDVKVCCATSMHSLCVAFQREAGLNHRVPCAGRFVQRRRPATPNGIAF